MSMGTLRLFLLVLLVTVALTACFPKKAGPHLSYFHDEAPGLGELAPDFTLSDLDGNPVSLSSLIGTKPIVLQLVSHTCPVYRYRRFGMGKLYREYAGKAHFLLVYTQEAHPIGSHSPYADKEWVSPWNRFTGVLVPQPASMVSRAEVAKSSREKLGIAYPMLIDSMNNDVWRTYGRAASPAYVIDTAGRIALRQPWIIPKEIKRVLADLIETDSQVNS